MAERSVSKRATSRHAKEVDAWFANYANPKKDVTRNGGQVWLSAEWNEAATDGAATVWRTWNWSARP